MKNTFLTTNTKALAICVGFFSLITFAACKEKTISGSGLIPPVDNIHTFNEKEFDIKISTHSHDSLLTNDYSYMVTALGQISNDPFFGATNASIYFQIVPPEANFKFPADAVIDSAVMFLPCFVNAGNNIYTYGDTSIQTGLPLSVNVHRITGAFKYDLDKYYYSFDSIAYAATPIGSSTVTIKDIKDTTVLGNGDTVYNVLRVKMSNAFVNELATASSNVYASQDAFAEYFKGLYVTPTAPSSFLAYFRLDGANVPNYTSAQVCFYYHNSNDTAKTTLKKNFKLSLQHSSFFNRITKDYTGSPATPYLNNENTDSIVIHGIPGIRTDITIDLDNKIPVAVVNKATLSFTTLNIGNDDMFTPPTQIIVMGVNEDGSEYYIADRTDQGGNLKSDGMDFVGGRPIPVTINGNTHLRYDFNIPREVQKCISEGKHKITLRVYSSTSLPSAYRMIAGGNNTTDELKVKFNVIYTLN